MDPSGNVCKSQDIFNTAVKNALKYVNDQNAHKYRTSMIISSIVYFIFLAWAIVLALSVNTSNQAEKLLHIVLACIAPPVYVVGFYITRS